MDYLFNLQEPGSLGALLIAALMVSGWVAEKVYPMKDLLEARRKAKAERLKVEVKNLWREKELAIDYLVVQGYTRKAAEEVYAKRTSAPPTEEAAMS